MDPEIQIMAPEGIDEGVLRQIRGWAEEVLERGGASVGRPPLRITVWKTLEKFEASYREEKRALGVGTGEETEFLAIHDAWRGYPRIQVCQERLEGISTPVIQGAVHHELSHALHHGTPEFYTFRFSNDLQEAGRAYGFDLSLLQQCVYFLSVAVKDREAVGWLARIGLGFSQIALLEYLISDTEEERRVWKAVCGRPTLRKIALAAFLKTLLPIEALISMGMEEARTLRARWGEAYEWLSETDQEALFGLTRYKIDCEKKTFQERLEDLVLQWITHY